MGPSGPTAEKPPRQPDTFSQILITAASAKKAPASETTRLRPHKRPGSGHNNLVVSVDITKYPEVRYYDTDSNQIDYENTACWDLDLDTLI